jgi:hypothetical protein
MLLHQEIGTARFSLSIYRRLLMLLQLKQFRAAVASALIVVPTIFNFGSATTTQYLLALSPSHNALVM